jgi:hypothetical protein
MWKGITVLVCLLASVVSPMEGQSASRTQGDSSKRVAIAAEVAGLLSAMTDATANGMLGASGNAPSLPAHERVVEQDIVLSWTRRYLPGDSLRAMSARLLAQEFSLKELLEIRAFCKSQTGLHFVAAQRDIRRRMAEEMRRRTEPHRAELRDSLRAAVERRR